MLIRDCSLTSTKELRLEVHIIKGVDGLVIVGLDLSCRRLMSATLSYAVDHVV